MTIGVLAKKKVSKTSESGRTFHVWEMSDIRPGSAAKSFSLFLFGDAAANAYKELEGALLLLINPALMPPKDGSGGDRGGTGGGGSAAYTGLTFKVDSAQCVKFIGHAAQYGMCTFQRPDWSSPCGQWLNTSEGDACGRCAYAKLHEMQALERAAQARGRGKGAASGAASSGGKGGATGVGARGGAASIDHRAQNKAELDAQMANVSWKHRPQDGAGMGTGMGTGMSTANDRAALRLGPLSYPPSAPPLRPRPQPATPRSDPAPLGLGPLSGPCMRAALSRASGVPLWSAPAPLTGAQRQMQMQQAAAEDARKRDALRQKQEQKQRVRLPLEVQLQMARSDLAGADAALVHALRVLARPEVTAAQALVDTRAWSETPLIERIRTAEKLLQEHGGSASGPRNQRVD